MRYLAIVLLILIGCSKFNGRDGSNGEGCTVTANEEGSSVISCPDGSATVVTDGETGPSGDTGKSGTRGSPGSSGTAGSSCKVEETATGSVIRCEDGSESTINHGQGCSLVTRAYGYDLTCNGETVAIRHGSAGEQGPPGTGIGSPRRRRCSTRYLYDLGFWWELKFTVTAYNDWSVFELIEVAHDRNSSYTETRQGAVISEKLEIVVADSFGASLSGDTVTFRRLGWSDRVSCRLETK